MWSCESLSVGASRLDDTLKSHLLLNSPSAPNGLQACWQNRPAAAGSRGQQLSTPAHRPELLLSTPTVLVLPRERTLGLQRDKSCLTMRRRRSFHPLEHAAEPAGPFPALEVRCQGSVADCSHTAATPRDLQGPRGYQCSQFQPVPHWEHPSCSPFASEQDLLCPRALQRHATVPAAREDAEGGDEESHPLLRPSPSSQALPRGRACSSSAAPLAASCLSQISSGCPPAAPPPHCAHRGRAAAGPGRAGTLLWDPVGGPWWDAFAFPPGGWIPSHQSHGIRINDCCSDPRPCNAFLLR